MTNKTKTVRAEDDLPCVEDTEKFCWYEKRSQHLHEINIPLDGVIREGAFYRMAASEAEDLGQGDTLRFTIDSPGGDLNGLIALLDMVETTSAAVVAVIKGRCHSAASMLALSCPNVQVSPRATMLVHFVSFNVGFSKSADVRAYVDHTQEYSEKLFREVYTGFLTEDEILACMEGKDMWMMAPEINKRLENKAAYLASLEEEDDEDDNFDACELCSEYHEGQRVADFIIPTADFDEPKQGEQPAKIKVKKPKQTD